MPRNTARRGISVMLAMALSLLSMLIPVLQPLYISGEEITGTLDAWIEGSVVNGSAGMKVTCQTLKQMGGTPPKLVTLYFNGTTGPQGKFNITVDSNTWGVPTNLNPYSVFIFSTYYIEALPGSDMYNFNGPIYEGNTTSVPEGRLMARDYPTGNLTVKVLNQTSGGTLEDALVELSYLPGFPDAPFPLTMYTDINGEVYYPEIRSVNTSVEITRPNFQPLSGTEPDDFVIVADGGDTLAVFDLTEEPWPFSVLAGSVDVNHSLPLTIDFKRAMDTDSILKVNNYGLFRVDGMVSVPFTLTAREGDSMVDLRAIEPLDFNTTYDLRIEPHLMDDVGTRPLWRAMTVRFTTELPPGAITGRTVDRNTLEPVAGLKIRVLDQISVSDDEGVFSFPSVPAGTYRMDIDESYLFNGTSRSGNIVRKGRVLDMGDIPVGPKSWGALKVRVTSDGRPLEGAWAYVIDDLILGDTFNMTTDHQGEVFFPRVVSGAVTVEVSAPHYNKLGDMASVPISGEALLEFGLTEDPLPVWVEAVSMNGEVHVHPGTDLLVHVPDPILFSSLNVTIWEKDNDGFPENAIPLSIEVGQDELTYVVDPDVQFPLESRFVLIVSRELTTLQAPTSVLWRDLEYHFSTADLPLAHISGTLLFEGMAMEDFRVDFGPFFAFTDVTGDFNISIDPVGPITSDIFSINGSFYGYSTYTSELELEAGSDLMVGTIDLFHVQGWYEVSPAPGSINVDPSTAVVFTFMKPIMVPREERFNKQFSVIADGSSAPVAGQYKVSSDNRTVTFTPGSDLEHDTMYHVRISPELKRGDNVSMFPLGNSTDFRVRPPSIEIIVMEPTDPQSLSIDGGIRISFSIPVKKPLIENDVSIDPTVEGTMFTWVSGSEVTITAFFKMDTAYDLELPAGIYGLEDEPLTTDLLFSFRTTDGYAKGHSMGTPQIFPSPESVWEPGQNIRLSGSVSNSTGYLVMVSFLKDGTSSGEATALVDGEGRYGVNISAPDTAGEYLLSLVVSMPGGPVADERTYEVEVGDAGAASEPKDDLTLVIILVIIILLVIAVIVGAVLIARGQRARIGSEIQDIDYTEVESEWEGTEDEW
ncbi:MAG: Ig-like domain-containing protein [Candidatus Thermoplasmatota archaeon]|nr:Ig-like domain-containing protein [Candidatus Thermoplasmatota archaeon]